MTGYTRLELGDCAKELHLLHQQAAQAELQAVCATSTVIISTGTWGSSLRLRPRLTSEGNKCDFYEAVWVLNDGRESSIVV